MSCHDPRTNPIARTLSDENGLSFWEPSLGDRRLEFSRHIIYNLSRPEKSLVLLAPSGPQRRRLWAMQSAKGRLRAVKTPRPLQRRGADAARNGVFLSTADPDYRLLLAMCEAGKRRLEEVKRFDMPGSSRARSTSAR